MEFIGAVKLSESRSSLQCVQGGVIIFIVGIVIRKMIKNLPKNTVAILIKLKNYKRPVFCSYHVYILYPSTLSELLDSLLIYEEQVLQRNKMEFSWSEDNYTDTLHV